MPIMRVEEIVYGVEDLELCTRFFGDVGLELAAQSAARVSFRTPVNQFVHLHRIDDPSLPAALAAGSNVREIVWGVDTAVSRDAIGAELSRDREVTGDQSGTLHTRDESGFAIAFRVAQPHEAPVQPRAHNAPGHVGRRNQGVAPYGRARPLRIIHVALDTLKESRERANSFYTERLHFRPIDRVLPMGTFMQCEGDIEHHNFLLCHRPDQLSINHIALEVRDVDEVVEGGNFMAEHGWKESRRLGRHNLGSNVFRMFHAPCGGRIEFAADMDRMDKSFKPRVWEQTPQHNLWLVRFPGDNDREPPH
jgi:Glyoxalase/Bleomycin resistance protein/Dioxygenase superfamily